MSPLFGQLAANPPPLRASSAPNRCCCCCEPSREWVRSCRLVYRLARSPAMAAFDDALATLPPPLRALIEATLVSWGANTEWQQVGANLRAECALAHEFFSALLNDFAGALQADPSPSPEDAWKTVCASHALQGAAMPSDARPTVLGRAWSVGAFAASVSQYLPEGSAERAIRSYARRPPARLLTQIRDAALGGAVIWGTFHPDDSTQDPFACLPATAEGIACALGLGYLRGEIVVLIYSTSLPLHRPTIADASSYSYYRPHDDPAAHHGYTMPLRPGVRPMPEVVHTTVTGAALILPYRIIG